MIISMLKIFALICTALICGKLSAKLHLPAILGWLIAGIVFGPYLAGVVTSDITDSEWYKIVIKFFEAVAGVMIGAGIFTATYIISRAVGKIGGAYLGGKITKANPLVTKYLGLTLLPHSGVSLVFTGIAVTTLSRVDPSSAAVISGTIVAAAIINEIIAVLIAKYAFMKSGEISS